MSLDLLRRMVSEGVWKRSLQVQHRIVSMEKSGQLITALVRGTEEPLHTCQLGLDGSYYCSCQGFFGHSDKLCSHLTAMFRRMEMDGIPTQPYLEAVLGLGVTKVDTIKTSLNGYNKMFDGLHLKRTNAIFGRPGTGKSIKGDETVFIFGKDEMGIKDVKTIWDEDNYVGKEILSLNPHTYKVELKKITAMTKHHEDRPLLRIKLKGGRSIEATEDHSFLIYKNNQIIPILGKDLKKDMLLPVMDYVTFPETLHDIKIGNKTFILDNNFGFIIGLILAEGSILPEYDTIHIANSNNAIRNKAITISQQLFRKVYNTHKNIIIDDVTFSFFFNDEFGRYSHGKKIPSWVFFSPIGFRKGILDGYISGDGTVEKNNVSFISKSKELRDAICLLLSSINIATSIDEKKIYKGKYRDHIYHRGYIWGNQKEKFSTLVDLTHIDKNERLKQNGGSHLTMRQIPLDKPSLHTFARENSLYKRGSLTREKIERLLSASRKRYSSIGKEVLKNNLDAFTDDEIKIKTGYFEELQKLINGDIAFYRILSVEYIPFNGEVYDFSVADNETFITSSGICLHNSLLNLQFAIDTMIEKQCNALILDMEGGVEPDWLNYFVKRGMEHNVPLCWEPITWETKEHSEDRGESTRNYLEFSYKDAKFKYTEKGTIYFWDCRSLLPIFAFHGRPIETKIKGGVKEVLDAGQNVTLKESPVGKLIINANIGYIGYDSISAPVEAYFTGGQANWRTRAKAEFVWMNLVQQILDNFNIISMFTIHATKDESNPYARLEPVGGKAILHNAKYIVSIQDHMNNKLSNWRSVRKLEIYRNQMKEDFSEHCLVRITNEGFVDLSEDEARKDVR